MRKARLWELQRQWFKLRSTVRLCATMFCARMFGEYQHSVSGEVSYAKYRWRGKMWAIPTEPINEEW